MKKKFFAAVAMGVLASSLVSIAPASAGSMCNNGSYSSNSGRGTCSWNGGVDRSYSSYSDYGSSSYNRNNGYGSSSSFGSSRNKGLGSTSTWGSSRSTTRCTSWYC